MNHSPELPRELMDIERALRASGVEPDAGLRFAVMSRVRRELADSRRRDFWRYAAGVAAAVLLILNVSLSAVRTGPATLAGGERPQLRAAVEQVRQIGLELPGQEIVRQCVLMSAGGTLEMYLEPYGPPPLR